MTAEDRDAMITDYQSWAKHLGDRLIQGERLARKSGRRARRRGKKLQITDGPYIESKEIIAGFWIVQADDLEQASRLADGLPFGKGELEIREIEP